MTQTLETKRKILDMTPEELLVQYEPMVHKFLRGITFKDPVIDYQTAAQELRKVIVKSAALYDRSRGAHFTTYVYTAMKNRMATLFKTAARYVYASDIDNEDVVGSMDAENLEVHIALADLTAREYDLLNLLLEGHTVSALTKEIRTGTPRTGTLLTHRQISNTLLVLREKFNYLKEG